MSYLPMNLAGFRVLMETNYDFISHQCRDYLADFPPSEAEITVSVSPEELQAEMMQSRAPGMKATPEYAESICLYRGLCMQLPQKNAMLLHAAVISDGEHAYAFTAPSGTGKSTHIRLWRKVFGESIFVVNGDKPILRLMDGVWRVYGTPWCGKEGWNTNIDLPLTAICFLSRSSENHIDRMSPIETVPALMHQVVLPTDVESAKAQMELLNHLVTHIPLYRLACNVSEEAARVAQKAMTP